MDNEGNIPEYRNMLNSKQFDVHETQNDVEANVCHQCTKLDLRDKVEKSEAYNKFDLLLTNFDLSSLYV